MRKGLFTDMMYMRTTSKEEARNMPDIDNWRDTKDFDFINEAGWYFKTLAAQEPGENNVLLGKEENFKYSKALCLFALINKQKCIWDLYTIRGMVSFQ